MEREPSRAGTDADPQKANTKDEDPTGLLNEGFRYRDLVTGSFITRDPAGFVDGPNLYTYVNQNPWTKFDPLGLESYPWYKGGWVREKRVDPVYNGGAKILTNRRVQGGIKCIGGALETATGVSVAVAGAPTVAVAIGGGAVAAHGLDTMQSGFRQAFSGREVDSLTSTGLQKAGMSRDAANLTDAGIGVVGSQG